MALTGAEKFVLVDILRFTNDVLSRYATTQDRLLFLIFIPHVVLILFIWLFADSISRMGGFIHTGIRALAAIAVYITIIFTGWYGGILAPLFANLWQMMVIFALIMFVGSRFIHPARAKEFMGLGKFVGEKITEKGNVKKKLEHRAETVRRMIQQIRRQQPTTAQGRQYQEMQLAQLRAELAELEAEING